jgi:O-antigen ligase
MPPSRALLPGSAIIAAFTVPLLVSKHTLPLATFYGEWMAGVLGVALVCLLAFRRSADTPQVPWIVLLPLWLILTTLVQSAAGMADITGSRFTTQIVLALGAAMMVAAWRLGQGLSTEERAEIVDAVAITFLVAGLLGTLAQWIQVFHMEDQMFGLVSEYFYDTNRRLWGNLNQPNHQATIHGFGLVAAIWLARRARLGFAAWLAAVLLLESGIALTGSRTGLVHVGLAAIYALIAAAMARGERRGPNPMARPPGLVLAAVLLIVGIVVLQPVIKSAGQAFDWRLFDTVAQLKAGDQVSARGALWAHAVAMFRLHPLLGVGYGEFGWAQFQQMAQVRVTAEMSLHAHNAVLDLLAKTGLMGTAGVGVLLLAWLWRVVRSRLWLAASAERPQTVVILLWLAMVGAHSMLEYPLHYLYFFLPFCFLLGWLEPSGFGKLRLPKPAAMGIGIAFVALSAIILTTLWQDYRRVEAREYASDERRDGLPMPRHWFRQHAASEAVERTVITAQNAVELLPAHLDALHLLPTPNLIGRTAWLLALTGQPERARLWMDRLRYYYQGDEAAQFNTLDKACEEMDDAHRPRDFCAWVRVRARQGHG